VRTIIGEVAVGYSQRFRNTLKILEIKSCQLSLRLAEGKNQVNFQATGAKTSQAAEEKKRVTGKFFCVLIHFHTRIAL
jgi:hypothetical protein